MTNLHFPGQEELDFRRSFNLFSRYSIADVRIICEETDEDDHRDIRRSKRLKLGSPKRTPNAQPQPQTRILRKNQLQNEDNNSASSSPASYVTAIDERPYIHNPINPANDVIPETQPSQNGESTFPPIEVFTKTLSSARPPDLYDIWENQKQSIGIIRCLD